MFNKKSLRLPKGFRLSFFRSYFFLGSAPPAGLPVVVAGLLPAAGPAVPEEGEEVAVCFPPLNTRLYSKASLSAGSMARI